MRGIFSAILVTKPREFLYILLHRMSTVASPAARLDQAALLTDLRRWSKELGFARLGSRETSTLAPDEAHFLDWLRARGSTVKMAYMSRPWSEAEPAGGIVAGNGELHQRAHGLLAQGCGRRRSHIGGPQRGLHLPLRPGAATYHKVMRTRLQRLCDRIQSAVGPFGYRVFTDSAPVLEKALARNAALGWIGKHTNLIDRDAGLVFFSWARFT